MNWQTIIDDDIMEYHVKTRTCSAGVVLVPPNHNATKMTWDIVLEEERPNGEMCGYEVETDSLDEIFELVEIALKKQQRTGKMPRRIAPWRPRDYKKTRRMKGM